MDTGELNAWWRRLPRPSATTRLAWGILSLTVSLILVLDLLLGIFPSEQARLRAVRERAAVSLAIQVKVQLTQPGGVAVLKRTLDELVRSSPDVGSIGVRRADGVLVAATAGHERGWVQRADGRSTLNSVIVPLNEPDGRWGAVEVRYRDDPAATGWRGWLGDSMLTLVLGLSGIGGLVYYFYLRRMLQHLDPSQAIPDRVRAAFDALAEGLLVLDSQHRIMLVNEAFTRLYPAQGPLLGRPIHELAWLQQALSRVEGPAPWVQAIQRAQPVLGVSIHIEQADREPRHALMNCAAICDAKGVARGCVLTLDDVTELDRANARLRQAMAQLEGSNQQIKQQNLELEKLANHDPMTGCMNRRAFYARAERLFAQARSEGLHLACVMSDIDKFKNFNDTHGHAVGDQVIQQVSRLLQDSMREGDLLCRYGGEEFCILLPATSLAEAMRAAQRMRERIEQEAGPGVHSVPGLRITSSFGVCTLPEGRVDTLDKLIEQADAGLYAAKEAGRNRVRYAPGVEMAEV
ncbi:MAG: diguanylate cyclase [Burkholderiales bacterium]|nr:diguanylate cyclase [Burkholderiales bacterium]MBH2016033.1 diguanylate cyclase [Burkholderiales bacterium]